MSTGLDDQSKNGQATGPATALVRCECEPGGNDLKLEKTFQKSAPIQQTHPQKQTQQKHQRRWVRTVVEAYLLIPLAALVLEAFFSLAGIGQGEIVMPDPKLGCRHIENKLVTWRLEGYSHDRLNSAGMRDIEHTLAKPAGIKRLAFLGDSFTEGLQVPLSDTFVRLMQARLNTSAGPRYETLNFGCSSYSTGQEMLQFEKQALAYKPDLVVLFFTPGDVLENSVSPIKRSTAEARPYFYLDQNNQLQQDNGLLTLNYEKLKPRPLREFLRAHSTIFGAYTQTNLSLSMSDKVYFRTTRLLSQISSKIATLACVGAHDKTPAPGLLPPSWQEPDLLAVSEAIIKRLDQDVKSAGGKLVVMAFPDIGKGDPLYIRARERLAKLALKDGFGYLDLSDAFSHSYNPNSLFLKVHFSKLGHDLTAVELTSYLKRAGYLPN